MRAGPDTPGESTSRHFLIGLLIITLLGGLGQAAFALRDYSHPDEGIVLGLAPSLSLPDRWDTNWALADVPAEFRYPQYNFSSYHYLAHGWCTVLRLTGLAEEGITVGKLRLLNPLLGMLAIVLCGLTTRQLASANAGLVAAGLLAMNPLVVQDAHYARGETMMLAGVAAMIWLLLPGRQRPHLRAIGAGGVLGWLVACKITMVLAGVAAPFLLFAGTTDNADRRRGFALRGILFAAGCAAGFAAGMPYGLLHWETFRAGLEVLQRQYAAGGPPYTEPGATTSFIPATRFFLATLGYAFPVALVIGALGLVLRQRAVVGSGMVATLLTAWGFFGIHPAFAERSFSPFLPIAALLGGIGAAETAHRIAQFVPRIGHRQTLFLIILTLALLVKPVRLVTILDWMVFSGTELKEQIAAIKKTEQEYPRAQSLCTELNKPQQYSEVLAALRRQKSSVLTIFDFGDLYTPFWLDRLGREIDLREVGYRPGLFDDLPICSLQTFHSPRLRFLVTAPAPPQPESQDPGSPPAQ